MRRHLALAILLVLLPLAARAGSDAGAQPPPDGEKPGAAVSDEKTTRPLGWSEAAHPGGTGKETAKPPKTRVGNPKADAGTADATPR